MKLLTRAGYGITICIDWQDTAFVESFPVLKRWSPDDPFAAEWDVRQFRNIGDAKFPDRAALVLGTSGASSDDGLLQVREIRDLPLRANLVVLSACDTGNGKLLGEEGIASLERAFLLAGAKAVIASLWTTDDTYTIALMRRLYQHLVDGSDKGASLRQAKVDLLKQFGAEALPVFWAGFTLVDDGSGATFN